MMMKLLIFSLCYTASWATIATGTISQNTNQGNSPTISTKATTASCTADPANVPTSWVTMEKDCVDGVAQQISNELNASMTYLAMGAHFSKDSMNRPGFAKLFFEAASEEREHAIKLIEYVSMRGDFVENAFSLIKTPEVKQSSWATGNEALSDALELEAIVTESIRQLIIKCEKSGRSEYNDYHFVDYLTGEYLTEQFQGQRDLAGKVSELSKMMNAHGALGEYMFDKKLLRSA